jgi:spermidine/putrescine transport system ATP-binding protein
MGVARSDGVGAAATDRHNQLQGTVDSLLFNGAASRVLVRTWRDQLIEVAYPHTGLDLRPEETVQLSWAHEHTQCFRDSA